MYFAGKTNQGFILFVFFPLKILFPMFPRKMTVTKGRKRRRKEAGADSLDAENFSAAMSPFSKVKGTSHTHLCGKWEEQDLYGGKT